MTNDTKTAIKQKLTAVREETYRTLGGLTDEQWNAVAYSEGAEWRVADILRHVADSEKGMTALMVQVRAGGEGVPADFDLTRWNQRVVTKLQDKTPPALFEGMAANRAALFVFIDGLNDDDWGRSGRHASLRIMTIEEICHLIADHEQTHVDEIRRLVS